MAGRLATFFAAMAVLMLARVLKRLLRLRALRHRQACQALSEIVHQLYSTVEVPREVREDHEMQRYGML
jgi:hypothetical protein